MFTSVTSFPIKLNSFCSLIKFTCAERNDIFGGSFDNDANKLSVELVLLGAEHIFGRTRGGGPICGQAISDSHSLAFGREWDHCLEFEESFTVDEAFLDWKIVFNEHFHESDLDR